jgi:hypothetical protein
VLSLEVGDVVSELSLAVIRANRPFSSQAM